MAKKVKQIVGGTLKDQNDQAAENFVSEQDAPFYAQLYKTHGISGGHIILLNARDSSYYEATKLQALAALQVYPGGLQVGGGITAENAHEFLMAGASHVIVTSYVFRDGKVDYGRLEKLVQAGYNIFVSGGTGSGKTTFLNVLSGFISAQERVITIEDSAELQLQGLPNLVRV